MTAAATRATPPPPQSLLSADYATAILNILEDFAGEKDRLEEVQSAILNILEDSAGEKARLEEVQRAMLNLLDDFDVERSRAEGVSEELQQSVESLRRAKEATELANRELEAFSYSVSHDLRAPLRAMDGFSLALLEECGDRLGFEGRDYLQRVRAASQRMGEMIDGMLSLSRMTRSEMRRTRVDLSALAGSVAADLLRGAGERRVEFIIAPGLVVDGDARLLRSLLENLLGNAWKFTSKHVQAKIELGALQREGQTVYFVRDDGAGFDMDYVNNLFGVFRRLHAATEFEGTGVGLATVQRIVQRHGGRVWAEGEPEQGATFYFTLSPEPR